MSRIAVRMVRDHPILGVGVGNYVGLYYKYAEEVPEANRTPVVMHNGYLAVWSEQGSLGLAFFLAVFGSLAWALVRTMRRPANDYIHYVSVALLGALVAHLMTQLGYPLLGDELGYLLMGFGVTIAEVNRMLLGEYPFRPTERVHPPLAVAAAPALA